MEIGGERVRERERVREKENELEAGERKHVITIEARIAMKIVQKKD